MRARHDPAYLAGKIAAESYRALTPYERGGLTVVEYAVLAAWDGGQGVPEIAQSLSIEKRKVAKIIHTYDGGEQHFERDIRSSSLALLAAISLHHPERVSA